MSTLAPGIPVTSAAFDLKSLLVFPTKNRTEDRELSLNKRRGKPATKPFTFTGDQLALNFATSAAGGILVEIQDSEGNPIPQFELSNAVETIGNEIDRIVRWKHGSGVSSLSGKVIRLKFVLNDADLFAFQFLDGENDSIAAIPD